MLRKRGPGEILGTTALGINADGKHHNTFRVGEEKSAKGFRVPKKIFMNCMADNPKFRMDVWAESFPALVHTVDHGTEFNPMINITDSKLRMVGKHSRYIYAKEGEKIQVLHGGLLVAGLFHRDFGLTIKGADTYYENLTFILPSMSYLTAMKNSEIIVFEEKVFLVKTDEKRGTWIDVDVSGLGVDPTHKSKSGGTKQVFANLDERMLHSEHDKQWRMAAKDGLKSSVEAEKALGKILNTGLHKQCAPNHDAQARKLDNLMTAMENSRMAGHHTQASEDDRSSLLNYQTLRTMQTLTATEKFIRSLSKPAPPTIHEEAGY